MSTYATLADLKAYTDLAEGVSDADLQKALDRAERDVDQALAEPPARQSSGLKYDPAKLTPAWAEGPLNRATCAQAEYRLTMGEEFFIRPQHDTVRGPDFATSGQLPYLAPKAARELSGTGLLATQDGRSVRVGSSTVPRDLYPQTDLLP
jgi:hypothetical protein